MPARSFKFAATLQSAHAGEAPVLIRIETKAGHGAGKLTGKVIDEAADKWAFLVRELGPMFNVMGDSGAPMNRAIKRPMNQWKSNLLMFERLNFTRLDRQINFV